MAVGGPSVAYADPDMPWVGLTEDEAKAKEQIEVEIANAVGPHLAFGVLDE